MTVSKRHAVKKTAGKKKKSAKTTAAKKKRAPSMSMMVSRLNGSAKREKDRKNKIKKVMKKGKKNGSKKKIGKRVTASGKAKGKRGRSGASKKYGPTKKFAKTELTNLKTDDYFWTTLLIAREFTSKVIPALYASENEDQIMRLNEKCLIGLMRGFDAEELVEMADEYGGSISRLFLDEFCVEYEDRMIVPPEWRTKPSTFKESMKTYARRVMEIAAFSYANPLTVDVVAEVSKVIA